MLSSRVPWDGSDDLARHIAPVISSHHRIAQTPISTQCNVEHNELQEANVRTMMPSERGYMSELPYCWGADREGPRRASESRDSGDRERKIERASERARERRRNPDDVQVQHDGGGPSGAEIDSLERRRAGQQQRSWVVAVLAAMVAATFVGAVVVDSSVLLQAAGPAPPEDVNRAKKAASHRIASINPHPKNMGTKESISYSVHARHMAEKWYTQWVIVMS